MNIYIGKEMLKESKEITLLGVILDNKMNFSSHFKKVYDKMKKGLNGLSMVKNQLTYNAKVLIYRRLIESHMNYCSLIWISNISKNKLKILRTIQKKALRIYRIYLIYISHITKSKAQKLRKNPSFRKTPLHLIFQVSQF